jgi:hypothetical protein
MDFAKSHTVRFRCEPKSDSIRLFCGQTLRWASWCEFGIGRNHMEMFSRSFTEVALHLHVKSVASFTDDPSASSTTLHRSSNELLVRPVVVHVSNKFARSGIFIAHQTCYSLLSACDHCQQFTPAAAQPDARQPANSVAVQGLGAVVITSYNINHNNTKQH